MRRDAGNRHANVPVHRNPLLMRLLATMLIWLLLAAGQARKILDKAPGEDYAGVESKKAGFRVPFGFAGLLLA